MRAIATIRAALFGIALAGAACSAALAQNATLTLLHINDVYEIAPELMTEHVRQQEIPNWDFQRIVDSRWAHLAWMHDHFADSVLSGEELLAEIEAEDG